LMIFRTILPPVEGEKRSSSLAKFLCAPADAIHGSSTYVGNRASYFASACWGEQQGQGCSHAESDEESKWAWELMTAGICFRRPLFFFVVTRVFVHDWAP